MKNIKIFNTSSFEKFFFGRDYLQICKEIASPKQVILINNNKFIAPVSLAKSSKLYFIENDKLIVTNRSNVIHKYVIEQQQLFYAEIKLNGEEISEAAVEFLDKEFKYLILVAEIKWLERFITWLFDHLSVREVDGVVLTNYPTIRNQLADTVCHLHLANQAILNLKAAVREFNAYALVAAEEILTTTRLLARLAGGRAFLSGNVLAMQNVFQAIHNVYFMFNGEAL